MTKVCKTCSQCLNFSFFYARPAAKDGYENICKSCKKEDYAKRYLEKRGYILARNAEWRKANPDRMKIAHWMPQTPFPQHQLDYWNLLGACLGNEGQLKSKQHCDTHQGDALLSRNPANPGHRIEDFIQFLPDGTITSCDPILEQELGRRKQGDEFEEGALNLNVSFLRTNRKRALNAFTAGLRKRGHLSQMALGNLISKWRGDAPGELDAYAPVIVYWLRKRLARA